MPESRFLFPPRCSMTKRPHWSYSQLNTYLRCPLQYYFQYIIGLPRPFVPTGLALGSSIHSALAYYHSHLQAGSPVPADEVYQSFRDAWQTRMTHENIRFQDDENEDEILAQGIGLLQTYLQEPPPENIVAVEQEMIAPLITSNGEVLEKPLVAVADLIRRDANGLQIDDFKTSSRAYSDLEGETSLQASCYAHMAHEVFGEFPRFQYTVLIKTKKPRVQRIEVTRTTDHLERLGDLVQTVERAVEAEIFYPVETPLNCSSCPFRKPCREWRSPTKEPEGLIQIGRHSESEP